MVEANKSAGRTLISGMLFIACPAVPILVGLVATFRSAMPFVAAVIVQLLAIAHVVRLSRSWFRPDRAARPVDYISAALVLVGGVAAHVMVTMIGEAYGISDSALPRLMYAAPTSVDLTYLAAVTAIVLTIVAILGLVVLLARTHLSSNALQHAGRLASNLDSALSRTDSPSAPLTYVTGTSDSWARRLISSSTLVVFGLCAVLSITGLWMFVEQPGVSPVGWLVLLAAVPVTGWSVLQSLWRPDEQLGIVMAALIRTLLVPIVAGLGLALLNIAVGLLTPVRSGFEQHQWPEIEWDGLFPTEESSLMGWLGIASVIGFFFALATGLVLSVAVVLPVTAFWKPEQFIKDNMMSTATEHRAANIAAVRALTLLIPLIFVIPGLLVACEEGSLGWWLGIVLIPAGLGLLYFVWNKQRVDHEMRAKWGVGGMRNSDDPRPPPEL